jgi:HlyD family secretion protein
MTRLQEKFLMFVSPILMAGLVGGATIGVMRARAAEAESESVRAATVVGPLPVAVIELGRLAAPQLSDTYRGVVVASKESELAFRRGGRVEAIEVKEGESVRKGDVLATLDAADIRAQIAVATSRIAEAEAMLAELVAGPRKQTIEAAEADVRRLQATADLARTTALRHKTLVEVNASSYQQFDDAKSAYAQASAALAAADQQLSELREGTRKEQIDAQSSRVASMRAQLDSLRIDLTDSRIVAPFDGVIARRYLDEGAVVNPQSRALRLLQIDPLEARFGVSPIDAASIRTGQEVTLTVGQQPIPATVSRVEPEVDLATRTQGLFVTIVSSSGVVPGQTVSLALRASAADSAAESGGDQALGGDTELWVPLTALSRADRGLWSLFVVIPQSAAGDDGFVVERREVQVLAVEAELARVEGALVVAGDRVVSGALHRVTPGMKVEPIE